MSTPEHPMQESEVTQADLQVCWACGARILKAAQPLESVDSPPPPGHPPQSAVGSQTPEPSEVPARKRGADLPAKKNVDVKLIKVDGKSYGLIEVRPMDTEYQIELIIKGLKSSMRTKGQRQAIDEFVRPSIERHGIQ